MSTQLELLSAHPGHLRERISQALRQLWVPAHPPQPIGVLPSCEVERLSRRTLDTMLTRQFRVGKFPSDEVYAELLDRVAYRVRRRQPILIALGYAAQKNPNTVPLSRADWAEFFALCHLVAWHNKVRNVYPPGLRIRIIFDDSMLSMANEANPERMKSYIASVQRLVAVLGYRQIIVGSMRHSIFAWLFHLGFYHLARRRVARWERDPANWEQIRRMDDFASRNVYLPPDVQGEERRKRLREASRRYRVYWEALRLSGLTRSRSRIVAMYLDGTQHHLPDPTALHLTSVAKGQVTQPWQGTGVLRDGEGARLHPFVLTAGRRDTHRCETVVGLNLVPAAGFDQIQVAWPVAGG